MAPIGEATLPWLKSTLPDHHIRVGSKTVLKKVKRTAGTYHSAQLGEGKPSIGNRAQCKGREGGITAGIAEGDRLTVETDMLDRDRRRGNSTLGQSPSHLGRFDRKDNIDGGWVVHNVESRAEADLDYPTAQPVGDAGAPPRHSCGATCPIHEPGQDVFTIKAHVRTVVGDRRVAAGLP